MALPRKDARTMLDHEIHTALTVFSSIDGVTIAEYIERLVVKDISKRVDDVSKAYTDLSCAGLIRQKPDSSGTP